MFLNVNIPVGASDCAGPVLRTPEILNLLSNAGPFDNNDFKAVLRPEAMKAPTPGEASNTSWDSSSFSSEASLPSPATPAAPSIRNARAFLVKEGLKLTLQKKRLASGRLSAAENNDQQMPPCKKEEVEFLHLTPEDEERRRRRRERNKVAATKCRNRKKEKTCLLLKESDILEEQNVKMRNEIHNLEEERRRLANVLAKHSSNCVKTGSAGSPFYPESSSYYGSNTCAGMASCNGFPALPNYASSHPSSSQNGGEKTGDVEASFAAYSCSSSADFYDASPTEFGVQSSSVAVTFHQL